MNVQLDRRAYFSVDPQNARVAVLQLLRNIVPTGVLLSNRDFLRRLAEKCLEIFGSQRVSILEAANEHFLQLLAVVSVTNKPLHIQEMIPTKSACARTALDAMEIIVTEVDTSNGAPQGGDYLAGDRTVVSIPISWPAFPQRSPFAINLHFDDAHSPSTRVEADDVARICEELHAVFAAFESSQTNLLRSSLAVARNEGIGASSVLSLIRPILQKVTGAVGLSLLTLRGMGSGDAGSVEFEFAMGASLERTFNSQAASIESWLDGRCAGCEPSKDERTRLLAWLESVKSGESTSSIFSRSPHRSVDQRRGVRFFDEMITRINGRDGSLMGFLWCYADSAAAGGTLSNFTSADLHALMSIAGDIAPLLRRLLDLRSHSPLLRVFEAATTATASAPLSESLKKIIRNIATSLNTSIGSIYIYDPKLHRLVMKAASGFNECLVGEAEYALDEGLTGTIARERVVLRFDTHSEMSQHPKFAGKHDHVIWNGQSAKCETFLGVPIVYGDELLGVLKLGNVKRTEAHPDDRFTEEDVQSARAIAAMLALLLKNEDKQQVNKLWESAISQTTLGMLDAPSEEVALKIAHKTLDDLGVSCMLSLLNNSTGEIAGYFATGDKWPRILEATRRPIKGDDILAKCLTSNTPEFIADVHADPHCNIEAAELAEIESFYVLPLCAGDERIGTLQLDLSPPLVPRPEYTNVIHSLASCLAYAVSRARALATVNRLAADVLSSGRAIATDLTMASATHDIGHQIDDVIRAFEHQLKQASPHAELVFRVTSTVAQLRRIEQGLKNYESPEIFWEMSYCDVAHEASRLLEDYRVLFRARGCDVTLEPSPAPIRNRIPITVFREILRELLTNAAEAAASKIKVSLQVNERYQVSEDRKGEAVCVDVSDDGGGMNDDVFHRIFEPRVTTKPKGTGMGLYFCRRFANAFGGGVVAYRGMYPGFPTTMRIIIPILK